tara:strand:- start:7528 stop:8145 length:618 start_codon:yes stop_codon:yes gene_type:complete
MPTHRIVPFTADLDGLIRGQAMTAILGDGSCSEENMGFACFACEHCNRGEGGNDKRIVRDFDASSLTKERTAFAAIDDETGSVSFMGCATADYCIVSSALGVLFPYVVFEPTAGLVSNLCVGSSARRRGIAKDLMTLMAREYTPLYVLVMLPSETCTPHVHCHMKERSSKLKEYYKDLGMEVLGHSTMYVLMGSRTGPPAPHLAR